MNIILWVLTLVFSAGACWGIITVTNKTYKEDLKEEIIRREQLEVRLEKLERADDHNDLDKRVERLNTIVLGTGDYGGIAGEVNKLRVRVHELANDIQTVIGKLFQLGGYKT